MLVIGSAALNQVCRDLGIQFRDPKDIDFICTEKEMRRYADLMHLELTKLRDGKWAGRSNDVLKAEFELLDESYSGQMYLKFSRKKAGYVMYYHLEDGEHIQLLYAPAEVLYSIKKSHKHYPRNWKKHIEDLMVLNSICRVDVLEWVTKVRTKETEARIGKLKTPSLDKKSDQFFNDNVSNKIFIHDDMHAVMAHREKPMYEYYKKDDSGSVACSKEKFSALLFEDRMRGVLEESYVIALERRILPMLFEGGRRYTADEAWDYAIMRICTTLCSGWFREFATMNYRAIKEFRDKNYVEKFLQAYADGKIHRCGIKLIQEGSI